MYIVLIDREIFCLRIELLIKEYATVDILLDDCYLRDEVLPPRDEPLLLPPLPPLYERLLDDEPWNELPDTVVLWCADDAVP